jgi:protoporphyrinogen/coproporphyrinogen III oxidase
MHRIVIIGAGISGLSLAYRLSQLLPRSDITILEEKDRVGGTIWTERLDGFHVEYGPNGFLDNNPSTLRLCQDLGLEAQLVRASEAASRHRYLYLDGRLHLLPHSVTSFLASDLLSWRGKMSILAERFRHCSPTSEDESINMFVRRHFGAEAAQVFADALVTGIQAGDPTLLSMRACFPRIVDLERQYGSVLKATVGSPWSAVRSRLLRTTDHGPRTMWSVRGGMRDLVESLARKVRKEPLLGVKVVRIQKCMGQGPEVRGQHELAPLSPDPEPLTPFPAWIVHDVTRSWQAEAVILTCPAYRQADILEGIDKELAEHARSIQYNKVAVVALGYRQADVPMNLNGFGYIAPQSGRRDTLGVLWCSSVFAERAPTGMVLLRAMAGGWNRPEILSWPDAQLLGAVRSDLRRTMGIESPPVLEHIIRWHSAIPQYLVGHLERVARIEECAALHPGLFLGGNAYHGIAVNDCTHQARVLAETVVSYLQGVPGG